jgi:hypothetical protein
MTPTAILLLNSQGHAASLAATSVGPLAMTADMVGFAGVLLATALIVAAIEKLRRR